MDPTAHKIIRMARRASFSSAHFYKQNRFSEHKNEEVFGACFTEHGHGHNYTLEAFYEGPIDPQTGLLVNLLDIDQILKAVLKPFDHHHLNFDVPYFKDLVPTTENIAKVLFELLQKEQHKQLSGVPVHLYKIKLFETEDLWVEHRENA